MTAEHFVTLLTQLAVKEGLRLTVAPSNGRERIERAERSLGVTFPAQVAVFYGACDGLECPSPRLSIFGLERLRRDGNRLHFAVIGDPDAKLAFDLARTNPADQWDIVNADTGFLVTRTMASFWSNKVFAWLERGRPIWADEPGVAREA